MANIRCNANMGGGVKEDKKEWEERIDERRREEFVACWEAGRKGRGGSLTDSTSTKISCNRLPIKSLSLYLSLSLSLDSNFEFEEEKKIYKCWGGVDILLLIVRSQWSF